MKRGGLVLLVLVWGVVVAGPAAGADYYVSAGGSDSGDGSQGSPWRTISKALATVNDGDRILLMSGNYDFPSPPPKNRTPLSRAPLVTPVALKTTSSDGARSSMEKIRSRSS